GITLEKGDYTSYGIIFRSMETSTLGSGAGVAMNISNIKVTAEKLDPEPTTATLSLLALAGLATRRRRSSL
ncbi:MAG: PEP-CTERM sorting domain-containing protein, partial [Akkermansia sp.]|nr:PEP-CTERM sorting domain-containing protein [Akkermansia sp.]